jgi:hypothetical protein
VAAVFVAIKVSPAAARALEGALALAHVYWRIWSDATDLIALAVLPVAWWLTARPARPARSAGRARRVFERASVIAGALACLATSPSGKEGLAGIDLELVNRARAPVAVAVYVTDSPLDCPAIAGGQLGSVAAATFTVGRCVLLEPGKPVAFGSIVSISPGLDASPGDDGGPPAGCEAVVIRAAVLADTVLTWPASTPQSRDRHAAELYLEEAGSNLFLAGTDYVDAAPAAFTLPASGCMGLP